MCVFMRWQCLHIASQYRDIISASVRRCGPKLEATSKNEVALAAWCDDWQTGQQAPPAWLPLRELWMYSVEAIDTIVLWRGGRRGGGLRTNNRALSLEMSAVTSGDCPARQTHFHAKSQGTKHVENTMKFDGDSASERVGWTRTFTPAGMERKWERGQQAMGNNTDHVKSVSKQNKDFQLSVWSSKPIC